METALKQLRDALRIMSHLEELASARLTVPANEYRQRIERNLAEITEKLNALLNRQSGQA